MFSFFSDIFSDDRTPLNRHAMDGIVSIFIATDPLQYFQFRSAVIVRSMSAEADAEKPGQFQRRALPLLIQSMAREAGMQDVALNAGLPVLTGIGPPYT